MLPGVQERKTVVPVDKLCADCDTAHPTKEHLSNLVTEGLPLRNEVPVGKKGHYLEVTRSFKCPKCGAIWENLIESGAGGHGNFWKRVDPPHKS